MALIDTQDPAESLRELASGVDALYLSGRAFIPESVLRDLDVAKSEAVASNNAVVFSLGGEEMLLKPHGFGKYRYCLDHPYGRIGITQSEQLPAVTIQPRAEFLHGAGPRLAVEWFRDVLESMCGVIEFGVRRLDLFADFQGWAITGDERSSFLCRADDLATYEASGAFNGLQFGKRASGTISARLYDKTIESAKTGSAYWADIWGDGFDKAQSVLRVEFEIARTALRQFGVSTPEEVLDATGALWNSLTSTWLSHRAETPDSNRSRWPVSSQWELVQRARVGENAYGISRVYAGKRSGMIAKLMPGLVGYLASLGALTDSESYGDLEPKLREHVVNYADWSGLALRERIRSRKREYGMP